jgi:DNA-binding NarL/FixJ family response regulator
VSIRVMIADDQSMVRRGFRMIVESEPDMEVVSEVSDGEQAIAAARRFEPDVVLMDIRMPNLDGIAATATITGEPSAPKVLILTTFNLDEYVYDALNSGASGFLLKNASPEELVNAVRVVARGDALLDPSVTRSVIEKFSRQPAAGSFDASNLDDLTAREREVLLKIAGGLSNSEIADELVLSTNTVKSHVASILMKLELRDRVQAVAFAYEAGLMAASA